MDCGVCWGLGRIISFIVSAIVASLPHLGTKARAISYCSVDGGSRAINGWGFGPAESVKGKYKAQYCGGGVSCATNPGGGSAIFNVSYKTPVKTFVLTGYLYKITKSDGSPPPKGMFPELTLTAPSSNYVPNLDQGSHWVVFRRGKACTADNYSQGCTCRGPSPQSCQFKIGS